MGNRNDMQLAIRALDLILVEMDKIEVKGYTNQKRIVTSMEKLKNVIDLLKSQQEEPEKEVEPNDGNEAEDQQGE